MTEDYRLSDLLDMTLVQRLADAHHTAADMPFSIIDAIDGSILVSAGWQDICTKFHRLHPETRLRCYRSDAFIRDRMKEPAECRYKCENGMWHIGMPIIVEGRYLATFFMSQFFFEDEVPERGFFIDQTRRFGFDEQSYMKALDRVPVMDRQRIELILEYDRALVRFISDIASGALRNIRADKALRENEERFRTIFDAVNDAILIHDIDSGTILDVNQRMCEMYGYRRDEIPFINIGDLSSGAPPYDMSNARRMIARAVAEGPQIFEWHSRNKSGRLFWVEVNMRKADIMGIPRLLVTVRDMSERKAAEERQAKLEEQLRQAQKMESIGLLAGGIAHDFNNLLTPILGYSEIMADKLPDSDPRLDQLMHIKAAADRARNLTGQLLAFSRRQILELHIFDLRAIVSSFEQILRSTIRENISIQILLPDKPSLIRADISQIEQVLMNLSINAQDAMPDGGTLSVEVSETILDQPYVFTHPDIQPGGYVMLTVEDTGGGMSEKAKEHLFEPFFTTKEKGKGTGLGLPTVYGIVKQHNGGIYVYSESGIGTTFKIYFPRAEAAGGPTDCPHPPAKTRQPAHGTETILLVEDNEMVRDITIEMLQLLGYHVLAPADVTDMDALIETVGNDVDLLLTDIILPKTNGKLLYERLHARLPRLKVLFMSGYTSNIITHDGVLDEGVNFLQKPITLSILGEKLRTVLDAPEAPA